jgi:hypothetical protein
MSQSFYQRFADRLVVDQLVRVDECDIVRAPFDTVVFICARQVHVLPQFRGIGILCQEYRRATGLT